MLGRLMFFWCKVKKRHNTVRLTPVRPEPVEGSCDVKGLRQALKKQFFSSLKSNTYKHEIFGWLIPNSVRTAPALFLISAF
jgi:hypothetical protein